MRAVDLAASTEAMGAMPNMWALPAMTAQSVVAKKAAPDTDEIMNSIVPKAILFRQCLMMSIWMHDKKQEDPMFVHMHTSQLRETNSTDSHAKSK